MFRAWHPGDELLEYLLARAGFAFDQHRDIAGERRPVSVQQERSHPGAGCHKTELRKYLAEFLGARYFDFHDFSRLLENSGGSALSPFDFGAQMNSAPSHSGFNYAPLIPELCMKIEKIHSVFGTEHFTFCNGTGPLATKAA
jgi:hypothetical protein